MDCSLSLVMVVISHVLVFALYLVLVFSRRYRLTVLSMKCSGKELRDKIGLMFFRSC